MSLSRRRYSTRAYLLAFSLALVLPLAALGTLLLVYYASVERARLEQQAAETAHQVAIKLDQEVDELIALLKGLASTPALLDDDLAGFHRQAARLVRGTSEIIVLRTFEPRQLLNTQVPFGQPLPPAPALGEEELRLLRSGKPLVSNVYASPVSGEPRIAVALAPLRQDMPDHKPDYLLAITVPTGRFHSVITEGTPPIWIVGVADRSGTYVTHTSRHEQVTGKPGWPAYLAGVTGDSGTFYANNAAGRRLLAGYYRSAKTGWLVAANVPAETLQGSFERSLVALGTGAAVVLAFSGLFAFYFSRRLAGSAQALAARAQAVGQGRDPGALASGVSEFSVIDQALTEAAVTVRDRAMLNEKLQQAVEQKEMLLKEVNHRVKNSLQLVASLLNLQRSRIRDQEARRQFEEAAQRINAVAQIHQRLYRDEHLDRVAIDRFLDELCADLGRIGRAHNVVVRHDSEPCYLATDRVIPVALIVNELITNAFKYSFPDGRGGVIRVGCRQDGEALLVTVADEGAALPAGFDPSATGGLGMKMIAALARQLRGTIEVEHMPAGKVFSLHVPLQG